MAKTEKMLSDKEHRNQFLEANVLNFLLLSWLESNHEPKGQLLQAVQNAKAITATTIDKLTSDYEDAKDSVDLMLTHLDNELHKILIKEPME